MSKKKSKKKPVTVQSTLGDLVKPKPKKKAAGKKTPTKKKTPSKKTVSKKKAKPKAKTTAKKPKKPSKKAAPKKKPAPAPVSESGIPITKLPGVGSKLAEKLVAAKYDSVEKISRSRAPSLAKKIDGLSKSGAKKLVAAAKDLVRKVDQPDKPELDIKPDDDDVPRPTIKLSDIPGVGSKMALSIERAGYNSVARLSRSRPDAVASKVDGLSTVGATKIVTAAKEMMKRIEIERITGDSSAPTVIAGKETKPTKEKKAPVKEEISKITDKEPVKKEPKKKTTPKKRRSKKKMKKPPAPKRTRPKAIKKSSGLPVPKSVIELTKELKQKWRDAEKRAKSPRKEDDQLLETVEVVALGADDTLDRLVENALEILQETMTTGRPAFEIPSRSGDNIVWDEVRDLLLLGMRTISRPYHSLASVVDATRTARVMEIIFNLLKANLHATKREVFYSDVNLFRDQKYSDKIIEDVSSMLKTTRDSVHIVASARGSAMGRVTIRDGGDLIDLTKMGTGGWAVTPFLDQLEIVESDAEFIIMSEKDAAVMRLAEAKYWNRYPCIVLTGKGSGDIATRAFLKMLVKELEIPAFALVDSDPYGHYIYSVFLRGSKRLSYESPFIATPDLKLLGVLSRDLDEYKIPKAVRIPMQPTDIKRVKDMLKEPFVQKNKEWVTDLKLMLQMKEKAEIQAFAAHSFQYLTDEYLPRKLETGDWI